MASRSVTTVRIPLTRPLELLQTHISATFCQTVFATVRTRERQRAWTLDLLVQFWLAVVLRAPRALTQALAEAQAGAGPLYPPVPATPAAFFQRCQTLRPTFFAAVFAEFTRRLDAATAPRYAAALAPLQARFAALLVVDGSTLAAIAHRLKLLWAERAVILPGCLLAVYDVRRGLCRVLAFDPNAAAAELPRAAAALRQCARDALLVADRLFCTAMWFRALAAAGCWGLVRRNRSLGYTRVRRLRGRRYRGGRLEEWLVTAGARHPVTLRLIHWHRGRTVHELLTNVLDPQRLPAAEALALYPLRWTIERMYYDLKEVLNLNRVYAANPNAIAMQVYAAACVYNAFRIVQGEVAAAAGLAPEALSPAKLFPKVAAACHALAVIEWTFVKVQQANPGRRLRRPAWKRQPFATVPLAAVLVEVRRGARRRRRFCAARARWKSFAHVRGGSKLLRN